MQRLEDGRKIGQIVKNVICFRGTQRFRARVAGGDGNRFGANGMGARDIVRRVTDHENTMRGEFAPGVRDRTGARESSELIAFMMIIRECADLEVMPDAVVRQFKLGAAPEISRQEPEHHIRPRFQRVEQRENARQQTSVGFRE